MSGVVDIRDPAANMYGCLPCPKCGSEYRWPTRPDHPTQPSAVVCDACGLSEPSCHSESKT